MPCSPTGRRTPRHAARVSTVATVAPSSQGGTASSPTAPSATRWPRMPRHARHHRRTGAPRLVACRSYQSHRRHYNSCRQPLHTCRNGRSKVLDEYQKAFGDSWKAATTDSTQEWTFLAEALIRF